MHSFVFWAHKITTTTHIAPNFHYLFTPASPQLQWTTWRKHWVTRSLMQCIFIQPMSLCLKETFNEFFELWPQIISSSILLVITKSGLILTFFSTGAKTGSEKRDIKGKGGLAGGPAWCEKRGGEAFTGVTTKKHFCENGCWITGSLFLPFTLHGSQDSKTDSCSQRV